MNYSTDNGLNVKCTQYFVEWFDRSLFFHHHHFSSRCPGVFCFRLNYLALKLNDGSYLRSAGTINNGFIALCKRFPSDGTQIVCDLINFATHLTSQNTMKIDMHTDANTQKNHVILNIIAAHRYCCAVNFTFCILPNVLCP